MAATDVRNNLAVRALPSTVELYCPEDQPVGACADQGDRLQNRGGQQVGRPEIRVPYLPKDGAARKAPGSAMPAIAMREIQTFRENLRVIEADLRTRPGKAAQNLRDLQARVTAWAKARGMVVIPETRESGEPPFSLSPAFVAALDEQAPEIQAISDAWVTLEDEYTAALREADMGNDAPLSAFIEDHVKPLMAESEAVLSINLLSRARDQALEFRNLLESPVTPQEIVAKTDEMTRAAVQSGIMGKDGLTAEHQRALGPVDALKVQGIYAEWEQIDKDLRALAKGTPNLYRQDALIQSLLGLNSRYLDLVNRRIGALERPQV